MARNKKTGSDLAQLVRDEVRRELKRQVPEDPPGPEDHLGAADRLSDFQPRPPAGSVSKSVFERKKWSLYFAKWGCLRCDTQDVTHRSNGYCERCHRLLSERIRRLRFGWNHEHPNQSAERLHASGIRAAERLLGGGYLTSTEAAKAVGISEHTLQLWIRGGKVKAPPPSSRGYRLWSEEDVKRLAQVKAAIYTKPSQPRVRETSPAESILGKGDI
jgi:hypothetical protein